MLRTTERNFLLNYLFVLFIFSFWGFEDGTTQKPFKDTRKILGTQFFEQNMDKFVELDVLFSVWFAQKHQLLPLENPSFLGWNLPSVFFTIHGRHFRFMIPQHLLEFLNFLFRSLNELLVGKLFPSSFLLIFLLCFWRDGIVVLVVFFLSPLFHVGALLGFCNKTVTEWIHAKRRNFVWVLFGVSRIEFLFLADFDYLFRKMDYLLAQSVPCILIFSFLLLIVVVLLLAPSFFTLSNFFFR